MLLDRGAVSYLANEEGIDPAFIEKDWHATRVLVALSHHFHDGFTIIFTGGTSLSKGHGLIKRFSEDLDFRVRFETDNPPNKTKKRSFRNSVIQALHKIEDIAFDEDNIVIDGLGFKIQLTYTKHFDVPGGIRPDLQLEFSYTQPRLEAENREISSMVAQYKNEPSAGAFLCLSPFEIAADKLSSIIWRVHKRDRADKRDDPTMIRHLHDLCALQGVIEKEIELFADTALQAFAIDQESEGRRLDMSLMEAAEIALTTMADDALYRTEYEQFVDNMSFARDDQRISFDDAVAQLEALVINLR